MHIEALCREANGELRRRIWTLVAEAGDGPYVPTLPALAALKLLVQNKLEWRGAAPCVGIIPYAAIKAELAPFKIHAYTKIENVQPALFRRLLGARFESLPLAIQQAHDVRGVLTLEGIAETAGASNAFGRLIARLFRLPPAGSDLPVRVEMRTQDDGSEDWTRFYPGVTMQSNLRNADAASMQLDEVFGALSVRLQWSVIQGGLALRPIKARLFGVPLPFLTPRSNATETVGPDGRFRFDVPIALPLIGNIAHYRGVLEPVVHGLPQLSTGHPIVDPTTI
jgi:Domain of unknown function (DUF4166)